MHLTTSSTARKPNLQLHRQNSTKRSSLRHGSPVHLAIILLLAVTGYRFWFSTRLELVPDEAYYWLWSKHLAASYRDKGPAIAWTIALGTRMFGDSVFGIRFFAVLLSTGSSWLLFGLARRLYAERMALWCLLMATVTPMLAVGSILMTIDTLSVFFWALAVTLGWDILHRGTSLEWPGYNLRPDSRALFVTDSMQPPPKALQVDCTTIEMVDDFWSQYHGRPMTHFRIYLCTGE